MAAGTVYLIHFDSPLAHAKHYIGYTKRDSPRRRLAQHRANHGARILMVLNSKGIAYHVVRIWCNVDRKFERQLKNRKGAHVMCPCCRPALKAKRYRYHKH